MSRTNSGKSLQLFSKINVLSIVKNHLNTLKDYGSTSYSLIDITLFFVFPFILSIISVCFGVTLNKDLVGILINVFSIFAGLLFNLLVLVYDVISKVVKPNSTPQAAKLKVNTLEEVYFNLSFEILLSLSIVIFLSLSVLSRSNLLNLIFSTFVFFLVIVFTLTLLMVLKRVNKLLSYEIEQQKNSIP